VKNISQRQRACEKIGKDLNFTRWISLCKIGRRASSGGPPAAGAVWNTRKPSEEG